MEKTSAQIHEIPVEASGAERRKFERHDLVVRVDYQTVDELFSDFARNINEGGIFVETDAPHAIGTAVDLQFKLPGNDDPIRVKGVVVHLSTGTAGEPSGMGIEFAELPPDAREQINAMVRSLRASIRS